ncbi:hypothetical protein Tco_1307873, partial [Tanacetum coccineum]
IPNDLEDLRACFQSSNHAIPSDESKAHIDVLLVLWGNRLPILDGSLPLSRARFEDWRLARAMERVSGLARIPEPTMVSSRSPRGATELVNLIDIRWHTRIMNEEAMIRNY